MGIMKQCENGGEKSSSEFLGNTETSLRVLDYKSKLAFDKLYEETSFTIPTESTAGFATQTEEPISLPMALMKQCENGFAKDG